MSPSQDPWTSLGEFIRNQRRQARLSLRQLADRARVSNPYLSQIERGLYRPSAHVIKSIATALGLPVQTLYERIGLLEPEDAQALPGQSVEEAVRADPALSDEQKAALLGVYRGFLETARTPDRRRPPPAKRPAGKRPAERKA